MVDYYKRTIWLLSFLFLRQMTIDVVYTLVILQQKHVFLAQVVNRLGLRRNVRTQYCSSDILYEMIKV